MGQKDVLCRCSAVAVIETKYNMTRNNTTSYREKGRAMFLAALMILSVVAVPAAFAGSAAATEPADVDDIPGTVYPGQEYNTSVATGSGFGANADAYLVEITRSEGDIDTTSLVGTLGSEANDGSDNYYEVDTTDLEAGNEYGIASTSSYQGSSTSVAQTFSVINEGFGVEFDDSEVDETDSASTVELSSDRTTGNYNVTVSVSGPDSFDADQIEDLFNATNGTSATVTDSDNLPLDYLGYDRDEGDNINDIRDDDYVTLNIANLRDNNGTVSGDDVEMNFTALDQGAGLPDSGEYEFEFIVADTGATATDTISIGESNEDASFTEGAIRDTAGDISTFEFELQDTDETWVQIGDEDSDFVEVLYVEADDENEPIEISVNTRLLGTDTSLDSEDVYDTENVETLESGYHDTNGNDFDNVPGDAELFGDDDAGGNNYATYIEDDLSLADDRNEQLTRPLQAANYELQIGGTDVDSDESVFDADTGGEATDQLASAVLELQPPQIGDVTIHTAPGESANDETDLQPLLDAATQREEIAIEDRMIVQVEATGIYGSLVAGPDGTSYNVDFDRLEDGVSTDVMQNVLDSTDESVTFEVIAEETTGNQDALEVDLGASDSDTYIVLDEEGGQFFLITDTSSDNAFANGDAPDDEASFTANYEYDADNDDERFEFATQGGNAFSAPTDYVNYPYLQQGDVLSSSAEFDMAPAEVNFDNVNVDDVLEAENVEDAEISGTTNVAPGSTANIRTSSTDASSSFRTGQSVNISDDGSVSAEFDFSGQEVGDLFDTTFVVDGSSVDSVDSTIVEEGSLSEDAPEDDESEDDESMDDDSASDDSASDDSASDDSSSDDSASDDGESDDSSSEETPGFGAIVALVAVLGAALLATRRQN